MKIRKAAAAILSLTMALTMLVSCGDNDSSKSAATKANTSTADDESKSEAKGTVVEEPDFLGGLIDGKTEYYNMSYEEFSKDGKYTKENALDISEDGSGMLLKFSLGSKDSFVGGRVKLDKAYDMVCKVEFSNNQIKRCAVQIDKLTSEEAQAICDKFMADLKENLPEGYQKATASKFGKRYEDGYCKGRRDMIYTIKRDEDFNGDYYVEFIYDNYAERYDIDHPQVLK